MKCSRCYVADDLENGIVVGTRDRGGDPICNGCVAETLQEVTMLSPRESQVIAFKQVSDLRFDLIADCLGIEESTANEYYRRAREKANLAERTAQELQEFL